ncbi:DUF4352 domain-containing protein [Thermincola ferriacetica]
MMRRVAVFLFISSILFFSGCSNNKPPENSFVTNLPREEAGGRNNPATADDAYANGLRAMVHKDYYKAIEFFEKVVPEDKNFQDACNQLKVAKKALAKDLIDKARANFVSGNIKAALANIEEVFSLDGNMHEAKELRQQIKAAYEASLRAEMKKKMAVYEGEGDVLMAVKDVRLQQASDNYVFVHVLVSVKNKGNKLVRLIPNNFTLSAPDGESAGIHYDTYDLPDYFGPVDLQRGESAGGRLIFLINKSPVYTLEYNGFEDMAAKKVVP